MSTKAAKLFGADGGQLLNIALGVGALYVGWQVFKLLRGIGGGVARAADATLDGVANTIVKLQTDPINIASDVRYVLPGGLTVKPSQTTMLAGGKFSYMGTKYTLVESLGGGTYRAVPEASAAFFQAPQKLAAGVANTDALWGPIGDVTLRQ